MQTKKPPIFLVVEFVRLEGVVVSAFGKSFAGNGEGHRVAALKFHGHIVGELTGLLESVEADGEGLGVVGGDFVAGLESGGEVGVGEFYAADFEGRLAFVDDGELVARFNCLVVVDLACIPAFLVEGTLAVFVLVETDAGDCTAVVFAAILMRLR